MKPSFWCVAQTKPRQEEIGLVNLTAPGLFGEPAQNPAYKAPPFARHRSAIPRLHFFCAPHHQPVQISCTQHQRGVSPG